MASILKRVGVVFLIVLGVIGVYFYQGYFANGSPKKFSDDIEHFKYGSIGAEVNGYPYLIWRVLPGLFPELVPDGYLGFGFYMEPGRELPVGVSVRKYGMDRVGFNCAACHTTTIDNGKEIILGAPSVKVDLQEYASFLSKSALDSKFNADTVLAAIDKDGGDLNFLDKLIYRFYIIPKIKKAFESMRTSNKWQESRPMQGPGRTDAGNPWRYKFGLKPELDQGVGTVDFPSIWNQKIRENSWLHWGGDNNSLSERNLSAALAGGASEDSLDHESIERVAQWALYSEPPKYPYPVDPELVKRGKDVFDQLKCGSCHSPGGKFYGQSTPIHEIKTDPSRWELFDEKLLAKFGTVGSGRPWQFKHYKKSSGYSNLPLDGIWARAPYLHNGSVPTLYDLFLKAELRPMKFFRGCDTYDSVKGGFACQDGFEFQTIKTGNDNKGHDYGTGLAEKDRLSLVEFLKTL